MPFLDFHANNCFLMNKIKLLDNKLISQIAAGEVVERPANAIKELVENSIDASAKNILIEIIEGGKKLIKVSDDGAGIEKEDLELAVLRHATSKISEEKDLWSIFTLGFRGEALSSIASVSEFSIKSRKHDQENGFELIVDGGDLKNKSEVAMNYGTTVCVSNLFYNTPARRKFLKNDNSESRNIAEILYSTSLCNPNISFKFINNNKTVFDLNSVSSFKSRIVDIYGQSFSDSLLPIMFDGLDFKIDGFIGKPSLSRSNTKHQFFFVNGRFIRNGALSALLKQAYHSMLMEHKNPVFFINISISPSMIDVNVHPKKTEIRFLNQQEVSSALYKAVKYSLEKNSLMPSALIDDISSANKISNTRFFPNNKGFSSQNNDFSKKSFYKENSNSSKQDAINFSQSFFEKNIQDDEREAKGIEIDQIKVLTQLNNAYIIAEDNAEIIIVDQHAGHERVRFEELMDQFENKDKSVQNLLIPQAIELSDDEKSLVLENISVFNELGFEIQDFGGNTFNVYSVPKFLVNENLDEVIKGVVDDILIDKKASRLQGNSEAIITYMACRSAVKFGQKLSHQEMSSLLKQMKTLKRPYTCPHGRPTMVSLNMDSLKKMFGRA